MWDLTETEKRFLQSFGLLSGLCLGLIGLRIIVTGSLRLWFLSENLALAWLSLVFAWLLIRNLVRHAWSSWQNILLSLAWLAFLPNTWYLLTDFIHVYNTGEISELYDIAMVLCVVFIGFILGLTSLFLVHAQLLKRFGLWSSVVYVETVVFLSSFAVYLGRDLRWNSWDVITNPAGIVLNVSDRLVDPFSQPRAVNVTALFFVIVSVMYFAFWLFFRPTAKSK